MVWVNDMECGIYYKDGTYNCGGGGAGQLKPQKGTVGDEKEVAKKTVEDYFCLW